LGAATRELCFGTQCKNVKNILLGANDQVYLADFGVSEAFADGSVEGTPQQQGGRVAGTRGTPAFLAPELPNPESSTQTSKWC
jgi:serine/threonine protein kinase